MDKDSGKAKDDVRKRIDMKLLETTIEAIDLWRAQRTKWVDGGPLDRAAAVDVLIGRALAHEQKEQEHDAVA